MWQHRTLSRKASCLFMNEYIVNILLPFGKELVIPFYNTQASYVLFAPVAYNILYIQLQEHNSPRVPADAIACAGGNDRYTHSLHISLCYTYLYSRSELMHIIFVAAATGRKLTTNNSLNCHVDKPARLDYVLDRRRVRIYIYIYFRGKFTRSLRRLLLLIRHYIVLQQRSGIFNNKSARKTE